ncbi:MAG: 6-phosphogluconolactonase [Rhodothermales bacterium]|nr:6-phosphogluconolactonase [Rhodothermales bacterium]
MDIVVKPDIHVFKSPEETVLGLADRLISKVNTVVVEEGVCSLLLSGGSTPVPLFKYLVEAAADHIPWDSLHIFWADERFVPRSNSASNFANAMSYFSRTDMRRAQIHPIPVDYPSAEEAAKAYEQELRLWSIGSVPRFDLVLLGMGADGHTASLFPGDSALAVNDRLVSAAMSPDEPRSRVTVTLPVLNAARDIHFLVTGSTKSGAISEYRKAQESGRATNPASKVQPESGRITLWLDEPAAGRPASG